MPNCGTLLRGVGDFYTLRGVTEIRGVIRYKSLGLVGKLLEGKSALRTLSWKVPAATGHGLAVKIPFFLVEAWGSIPP